MNEEITKPGKYQVKSHSKKIFEIDIIDRDGELGAWFGMTFNFINIKEFVGVEVLSYEG